MSEIKLSGCGGKTCIHDNKLDTEYPCNECCPSNIEGWPHFQAPVEQDEEIAKLKEEIAKLKAEVERLEDKKEQFKTRMLEAEDESLKAYGLLEDAREWLDTWLLQDDCTCVEQCICGKNKLRAFVDSIRGFVDDPSSKIAKLKAENEMLQSYFGKHVNDVMKECEKLKAEVERLESEESDPESITNAIRNNEDGAPICLLCTHREECECVRRKCGGGTWLDFELDERFIDRTLQDKATKLDEVENLFSELDIRFDWIDKDDIVATLKRANNVEIALANLCLYTRGEDDDCGYGDTFMDAEYAEGCVKGLHEDREKLNELVGEIKRLREIYNDELGSITGVPNNAVYNRKKRLQNLVSDFTNLLQKVGEVE